MIHYTSGKGYDGKSRALDILQRGVGIWNRWRNEHCEIQTDLRGADLKEMRGIIKKV